MMTLPPLTAVAAALYLLGVIFVTIAVRRQLCATHYGDRRFVPDVDEPPDTEPYGRTGLAVQPMGLSEPIWTLYGVLFFMSVVGRLFVQTTYYNYFLLNLLFWPHLAVVLTGSFAAVVISPIRLEDTDRWWDYVLFHLLCLACAAVFVWASLTWISSGLPQQSRALQSGPQPISGVIADKDSLTGKVSVYSITVDGVKYITPNDAWWHTLRRGQRVDFVRDPDGSVAFAPGHLLLNGVGIAVAVYILGLWLVTAGFVAWRLATPVRLER